MGIGLSYFNNARLYSPEMNPVSFSLGCTCVDGLEGVAGSNGDSGKVYLSSSY
jgi:hypothetical protein